MAKGFKDDKGKFRPTGDGKPPTNFNFNNDDDEDDRTIEELLDIKIDERLDIRANELLKEKEELQRPISEVTIEIPAIPETEKPFEKSFKQTGLSEEDKFDYQGGYDRGKSFAVQVMQIAPAFTIGSTVNDGNIVQELALIDVEPEELSMGIIKNKEDAMKLLKEVAIIAERSDRASGVELDGKPFEIGIVDGANDIMDVFFKKNPNVITQKTNVRKVIRVD